MNLGFMRALVLDRPDRHVSWFSDDFLLAEAESSGHRRSYVVMGACMSEGRRVRYIAAKQWPMVVSATLSNSGIFLDRARLKHRLAPNQIYLD
jgi:hypothetical protein